MTHEPKILQAELLWSLSGVSLNSKHEADPTCSIKSVFKSELTGVPSLMMHLRCQKEPMLVIICEFKRHRKCSGKAPLNNVNHQPFLLGC